MESFTTLRFSDLENHLEAEGGEFYMGREALESPQLGVSWIRLPAGTSTQGDKGHYHDHQDEVYIVVSGGPVEFKVEDEKIDSAGERRSGSRPGRCTRCATPASTRRC